MEHSEIMKELERMREINRRFLSGPPSKTKIKLDLEEIKADLQKLNAKVDSLIELLKSHE